MKQKKMREILIEIRRVRPGQESAGDKQQPEKTAKKKEYEQQQNTESETFGDAGSLTSALMKNYQRLEHLFDRFLPKGEIK